MVDVLQMVVHVVRFGSGSRQNSVKEFHQEQGECMI
jgi:hypothetical protein